MSSADSYINSAAVTFSSDIITQISPNTKLKDLTLSRIFSIVVGASAFFLAFKAASILKLVILILSFYAPVVTGPLFLALYGFRSTVKTVLIGMTAGLTTVLIFEIMHITAVDSVVPGIFVNIVFCLKSFRSLQESFVPDFDFLLKFRFHYFV